MSPSGFSTVKMGGGKVGKKYLPPRTKKPPVVLYFYFFISYGLQHLWKSLTCYLHIIGDFTRLILLQSGMIFNLFPFCSRSARINLSNSTHSGTLISHPPRLPIAVSSLSTPDCKPHLYSHTACCRSLPPSYTRHPPPQPPRR